MVSKARASSAGLQYPGPGSPGCLPTLSCFSAWESGSCLLAPGVGPIYPGVPCTSLTSRHPEPQAHLAHST